MREIKRNKKMLKENLLWSRAINELNGKPVKQATFGLYLLVGAIGFIIGFFGFNLWTTIIR